MYQYMVIDLKVLVRSLNCESRACYVGNPCCDNFFEFAKDFFFRERFTEMGYYESLSLYTLQLVKGYLLPPGGPAAEWYRTFSFSLHMYQPSFRRWGFATAKYRGLEAHPCTCPWYCLKLLSEVWRSKLQMQQPSFQKWGFARAKHQDPWFCFSFNAPPCWLGSADRDVFAKVPRKFCEEVAESQRTFWREWPSKPCKKLALSATTCPEKRIPWC